MDKDKYVKNLLKKGVNLTTLARGKGMILVNQVTITPKPNVL